MSELGQGYKFSDYLLDSLSKIKSLNNSLDGNYSFIFFTVFSIPTCSVAAASYLYNSLFLPYLNSEKSVKNRMTVVGEGNKNLDMVSLCVYINRDVNRQI